MGQDPTFQVLFKQRKISSFQKRCKFLLFIYSNLNSTEGILQIDHTQTHLDTEQNYTLILNWKQPKLKMYLANTKKSKEKDMSETSLEGGGLTG